MAHYNAKVRGLIEGLSDFWLYYFKEIDQLEALFKGTDILVGQSYLDLLSLLLNNSVQDAPLFNKEFFKHIFVKETEVRYKQRAPISKSAYLYTAEDNLVSTQALNNKIFSITSSLERDVDFTIEGTERVFAFNFDPLNAYTERVFGAGNSLFKLRTREPGATMSVQLVDNGTTPATFTLNNANTELVIAYDGPSNGATSVARSIVSTINNDPVLSGLLLATLVYEDQGNGSPAGTALLPLIRPAVSPLDGYATRVRDESFGGSYVCSKVLDWTDPAIGIEKGDILRLKSGPTIGRPVDFNISVVRADALYLNANTPITNVKAGGKTEFSVLREPENNNVIGEPYAINGFNAQTGIDGILTAVTRNFNSVSATFSPLHEGDTIELLGALNIGYAQILSVVDANNVIVALTSPFDEATITWNLLSVCSGVPYTDGVLTNAGDGTGTFSSASASFVSPIGTVIKIYRAGEIEKYEVTKKLSNTSVQVSLASTVAAGTGLTWIWADVFSPTTTLAYPFVKKGSETIYARRVVDEQAVVLDRDYVVDEDTATITPKTVWRADAGITINYAYRLTVLDSGDVTQNGVDGVLTFGLTSTFTAASASFTYSDIGQAIRITNSGLPAGANNGIYVISTVVSSTVVELTTDRRVSSTVDPNNSSLTWQVLRRGTLTTESVTAPVHEIAFWAPDALIDRFHLYNTFGYLINRFQPSSEEYRSLIRGIFQLFMLGPTLERFESAMNIVAGLPVIRDTEEILSSYGTDSYDTGTDGYLTSTRIFTAASATFDATTLSDYIYITSGANAEKLFKVVQVIDSTTLMLDQAPVAEGPVSWEISTTDLQTVTTSRNTYTFKRNIPLKSKITDPANFGVLSLRAFEVMSDVFTVTDYIETPTWWERATIPAELWEGEDELRRNSTPALFENVLGAGDEPKVGDPGFVIGADSKGFVPPSVVKYDDGGLNDGSMVGDLLYPSSNNVYFNTVTNTLFTSADTDHYLVIGGVSYASGVGDGELTVDTRLFYAPSATFTGADVGNYVEITNGVNAASSRSVFKIESVQDVNTVVLNKAPLAQTSANWTVYPASARYRIEAVLSSTQVKLEAFVNVPTASGLSWHVEAQALPLRHKAAFVILDTWLKHHMFSVSFNPITLGLLGTQLIADLQSLVFVAKPAYTYIVVTPSTLFKEFILVDESDLEIESAWNLGGSDGEVISGEESNLLVIGSSWTIGNWFRYLSNTSTFSTPTTTVNNLLGSPAVGYAHYATKVAIANTFVDATHGLPLAHSALVPVSLASGTLPACVTTGVFPSAEASITLSAFTFTDAHYGCFIRITGTATTNDNKDFVIGEVRDDHTVIVGEVPISTAPYRYTLVNSANGNWQLFSTGSMLGNVYTTDDGETLFDDVMALHAFNSTHVGTYIRFVYTANTENKTMRINEVVSATQVKLATVNRAFPHTGYPDLVGSLTSMTLTMAAATFTPEMGYTNRVDDDPTTAKAVKYYVVCNSGVNAGERRLINEVVSATEVVLTGTALTNDATLSFYVETDRAYSGVVDETSQWEHVKETVIVNGNTLDLSNVSNQGTVASVSYTAYGVREPIDPALGVYSASSGDSYYYIGMPDPRPKNGRSRSSRDADMREDPIQITRT
jgi:hypothetical protein